MNANHIKPFLYKVSFFLILTQKQRSKWIYKHKELFHSVGKNLFFQPRKLPADPELISFGNNVYIASDVTFINHDIIGGMLNRKFGINEFGYYQAPISIGDNVMIGSHSVILPNVKISDNVIVGAGSIVTKDIPNNSVVVGVPAKVIGSFDEYVDKRRKMKINSSIKDIWDDFENCNEKN